MSLHRYILDVEYDDDSTTHQITVTVKRSEQDDREIAGSNLLRMLKTAIAHIHGIEMEEK